jgi:hypothetical protein
MSEPARFCDRCGQAIVQPERSKTDQSWTAGIAAIAIVFLVAIVFSLVSPRGADTENTAPRGTSSEREASIAGNKAHNELAKVSPAARTLILAEVAGEGCVGSRSFYMGTGSDGAAYWSVGCFNGASYYVEIQPNATGSTKVVNCAVLRTVSKMDCFRRLDEK